MIYCKSFCNFFSLRLSLRFHVDTCNSCSLFNLTALQVFFYEQSTIPCHLQGGQVIFSFSLSKTEWLMPLYITCAHMRHIFLQHSHLELKNVMSQGVHFFILQEIAKNTLNHLQQFTFLPMCKKHVKVGHILATTGLSSIF